MKHVFARGVLALCLLMPAAAWAGRGGQAPVDDEEKMDTALRKFGYVAGQAFQCHTKEEQDKLERVALTSATNILRLFGSDRAFYFAAAFGSGVAESIDPKNCPAAIKKASEMVVKLKTLAER